MRITIVGHSGSGKSTLAEGISKKLNIPLLHIDRIWFESGGHTLNKKDQAGKERVRDAIKKKVEDFIKQESWVSDGWYPRVQPLIAQRANTIVFIDIPLWRRVLNHYQRIFFTKRHPELKFWDEIKFAPEIIRRTLRRDKEMRNFVNENKEKLVHLRNYKEVDDYFSGLQSDLTDF